MRNRDEIIKDIPRVVNNALFKFWEEVIKSIPESEANVGDMDRTWLTVFYEYISEEQCSEIITHWVDANVPMQSRNYNVNRPLDGNTADFEMKMTKLIESYGAEMQTETFDANGKELVL